MRASRYHGRHDLRIEDIPEPQVRPGTVKLRVDWTGICGTDLHEYEEGPIFCPAPGHPHPLTGETVPVVLGHEMAGVITELGDGVSGFEVGDRVAVEPLITCGTCRYCTSGDYNLCTQAGYLGLSGGGGGFAEFVVVEAKRAFRLGDLPTDIGALVEPLAVAHHAVRRSGAKAGDQVAVFGAGPIGLFVLSILKAKGIDDVYSVEISSSRKEKAASAGARAVLDPTEVDVPGALRSLTGGIGADISIEAVGINASLQSALDSTRSGGTVVNISIWGRKAEVDMFSLVMRELTLVGTSAYCDDHAPVIELLQSGALRVDSFITKRIAVEDAADEGIHALIDDKDRTVKILVHP